GVGSVGFRVTVGHLDSYAEQVARASGHADACIRFLDGNDDFDSSGVLIRPLEDAHGPLVEQVRGNLDRIRTILDADVIELRGAAGFYRRTDRVESERLDSTYPPVAR
ncbi:MAG: hypothetical protein LC799_16020, partial [Actinobacteria bacterium]|nr:hypothetical protein [Actinomycetota bacterium]